MDPTRFDTISRLVARRRTRRQAAAGTAGLVASLAVAHSLAQEGTPSALPDIDPSDPHPGADGSAHEPEYLFVQPFASGAWSPREGEDGAYTLTLSGAAASTVYFSDRPDRIFGLAPTGSFLDGLGFSPVNPPNAALVAQRTDGSDQEVLVIELFNPSYDGDTLSYDARVLADYGETGLVHAARQQSAYELPETFAEGSLFIDDCSDGLYHCIGQSTGTDYGLVQVGNCYDVNGWSCKPCHEPDRYCMNAYPSSCKKRGTLDDGTVWDAPVCNAIFVDCVGSSITSLGECGETV